MAKNFALIGAAGYIAPRHFRAIKENGGHLRAALDRSDSVGSMDSYFPDARFFVEFERFDRYVDRCRRTGEPIDYVSICSPNYLHDAHVRFALRNGADAICERPLVLNPWNVDGLAEAENSTGRKVHTILRLRLHPAVLALRDEVARDQSGRMYEVDLTYVTPRGPWHHVSWKGDDAKSGGLATVIGIDFFDLLHFVFGNRIRSFVHHRAPNCMAGYLEFQHARVRWLISIDARMLPPEAAPGERSFRAVNVDGRAVRFSENLYDLLPLCYREILAGNGSRINDARSAVETAATIRTGPVELNRGEQHPLLSLARSLEFKPA